MSHTNGRSGALPTSSRYRSLYELPDDLAVSAPAADSLARPAAGAARRGGGGKRAGGGAAAANGTTPEVDWAAVAEIRAGVSERLTEELGTRGELPADSQRELARSLVAREVAGWADQLSLDGRPAPSPVGEEAMAAAVMAAIWGLGRIQPLVDNPDVENIHICGYDDVWLEYADGRIERGPVVAESDADLIAILQSAGAYLAQTARSFSTANPRLRLRLPDGSRLTAIMEVTPRPTVHIRRHRLVDVGLQDLLALGTVDPGIQAFLRAAMAARANIVVSGTVNAGKTTTIRALANEVDPLEKICTIEKEYELLLHELPQRHAAGLVIAMEAREGNAERGATGGSGAGQVTLPELVEMALKMSPKRIIVGEVLGDEILPMLRALSSGTGGSLCTIHARTGRGVFDRIVELALTAPQPVPAQAAHTLAANGIDYVVHLELVDERAIGGGLHRFVSEILEVAGLAENGRPATNEIYTPGPDGRAVPSGTPLSPRRLAQMRRVGYDPAFLDHREGLWSAPIGTLVPGGTR